MKNRISDMSLSLAARVAALAVRPRRRSRGIEFLEFAVMAIVIVLIGYTAFHYLGEGLSDKVCTVTKTFGGNC